MLESELGKKTPLKKTEFFTGGPGGLLKRRCQTGLVKIAAVRGMLYVTAGLLQIAESKKGADDLAITLPHNRKAMLAQAERQLNRYQKALEKIVPRSEFWRFGDNSESPPPVT